MEDRKWDGATPFLSPSLPFLFQQQLGGMDHWNFMRKPASDFGWDWGPAFAPAGIAGGAKLVAHSTGFISGATARQEHDAASGSVALTFDAVLSELREGEEGELVLAPAAGEGTVGLAAGLAPARVRVSASAAAAATPLLARGPAATDSVVPITLTIPASSVALWWPHGYGRQPLYGFDLTYTPTTKEHDSHDALSSSSITRRVGLRTVALVRLPTPARAPGPAPGQASETFHFEVNGVPVWAKGANYIPPHIFHSKAPGLVRGVIAAAAAAHMNMVRVWGGGAYPPSEFYEACDEMGVLVWQEFMAACAFYPRDAAFLSTVTAEVVHQARRFGHHASLALWGGNNELEPAFTWFEEAKAEPRLWAVDYSVLFVDTVRAALLAAHAGVPFIDASPTNGVISEDPYVKRWGDSSSPYAGDVHFYDYKSDPLDPSTYPAARFVSEFGFQSYPSADVAAGAVGVDDRTDRDGPMWAWRQRHEGGNAEMEAQVGRTFRVPPRTVPGEGSAGAPPPRPRPGEPPSLLLFRHWAYLTQAAQALAYDTAIAAWRRLRSDEQVKNGGVLYWQLNDIWAGQSWSGLDFPGGAAGATPPWRLLHHFARRFYAPLALSVVVSGDPGHQTLAVWGASDVNAEVLGDVTLEVVRWDAGRADGAAATLTGSFRLPPLTSAPVYEVPVATLLKSAGVSSPSEVVVRAVASGAAGNDFGAPRVGAAGWEGDGAPGAAATPAAAASAGVTWPADPHRVSGGGGGGGGGGPGQPASLSAEAVSYLTRPKDAAGLAVAPTLRISGLRHVSGSGGKVAEFSVAADAVAPLVSLASGPALGGTFSDSGFLLLPWEPRTVRFEAATAFDLDTLAAGLGGSLSLGDTLVWGGAGAAGEGRKGGVVVRPGSGGGGGRDEF